MRRTTKVQVTASVSVGLGWTVEAAFERRFSKDSPSRTGCVDESVQAGVRAFAVCRGRARDIVSDP